MKRTRQNDLDVVDQLRREERNEGQRVLNRGQKGH